MPPSMRPPPSRRSNFEEDTPSVIYSQAAADFRPPADYIGPRKSKLQRRPDPSMNPKKNSLPILSVSRLTVQNVEGLPPVKGQTRKGKCTTLSHQKLLDFNECQETKKILLKMPSSLRKQFRQEIQEIQNWRKKRPCRGNNRHFMHFDFHDPYPPPPPTLNGLLLLGGEHRDMVEEAPQEPGTPPPLSGRRHCIAQTDTYLENIMDNEVEFNNVEMQCEPVFDDSTNDTAAEPKPLGVDNEGMTSVGTQLDDFGLSEIADAFHQVSTNLADAVIIEALRQLQEEFELEALRKQHEVHKCLRNREVLLLEKYKQAQADYEKQKRYLASHKSWEEDLDSVIAQVGFDKVRENAPSHFNRSEDDQAIHDLIENQFLPPIKDEVPVKLQLIQISRNLLDAIIEETTMRREADYAVVMNAPKGSLATDPASTAGNNLSEGEQENVAVPELELDTPNEVDTTDNENTEPTGNNPPPVAD